MIPSFVAIKEIPFGGLKCLGTTLVLVAPPQVAIKEIPFGGLKRRATTPSMPPGLGRVAIKEIPFGGLKSATVDNYRCRTLDVAIKEIPFGGLKFARTGASWAPHSGGGNKGNPLRGIEIWKGRSP